MWFTLVRWSSPDILITTISHCMDRHCSVTGHDARVTNGFDGKKIASDTGYRDESGFQLPWSSRLYAVGVASAAVRPKLELASKKWMVCYAADCC